MTRHKNSLLTALFDYCFRTILVFINCCIFQALLENLSSDEFSDDDGSHSTKKKSKKGQVEE